MSNRTLYTKNEYYTLKTNIIRYHVLSKSTASKFSNQKKNILQSKNKYIISVQFLVKDMLQFNFGYKISIVYGFVINSTS